MLKLVQTALMPYSSQCESLREMQCKVAQPTCSSEQVSSWSSSPVASPSRAALPALGFKGVLQQAAQAVAHGKAREFMEDYLSNHPDTVQELTGTLANRIKTLLRPETTVATTGPPSHGILPPP